jgi:gluconolactonase
MNSMKTFATAAALFGALLVSAQSLGQGAQAQPAAAPAAPQSGPGVQALRDSRYPSYVAANCKTPPAVPATQPPRAAAPAPAHRDYKVAAIPGVIAAGATWKTIWTGTGNNADGPVATADGGMLFAQNSDSKVMKLDASGKASFPYSDTNTGGALAMSKTGALYVLQRGLPQEIWQLEPKRQRLASSIGGEPLDCAGGLLNDMTADSKGGVYFTMGGVFHADAKGNIVRYGENLNTNGIMLSPDEKHLWVTNGATLAEFDVQKDGSLTNQREFAKLIGGGDGSTFDSAGRFYVTAQAAGIEVLGPDGKSLGVIPTPHPVISVAFSGPDRKTLYAVSRDNATNKDWIIAIQMISQGTKVRGK